MLTTLSLFAASVMGSVSPSTQATPHQLEQGNPIVVGWQDEMDAKTNWSPLEGDNIAFIASPVKGSLFLGLGQVPAGWPHSYQWSGVSQDAEVDVARFPVVMARLNQVQGYAHLDIDVLGAKGEVVKQVRTTTLQSPGLCIANLAPSVSAKRHRMRLRLIVGGPNDGCCVTYDWVRFVSKADAARLEQHPDLKMIHRAEE